MTAGEGSPAVVIVPAFGEPVLGWLDILRGAAADTRACVYDRKATQPYGMPTRAAAAASDGLADV